MENRHGGPFQGLTGNVSRGTSIGCVHVAFLRGVGGENISPGSSEFPNVATRLMIYSKRYNNLVGSAQTAAPHHRAFVDDRDGQIRVTGSDLTGINAMHLGFSPTTPVLSPHEEDWLNAANGVAFVTPGVTLVNGAPQLAANYTALRAVDGGRYVWANLADFNANAE